MSVKLLARLAHWFGPKSQGTEPQFGPVRWIGAADNPWRVDILDCREVTQTMVSTTGDPEIAERFFKLRTDTGSDLWGRQPEACKTATCDLSYPCPRWPGDGPLFTAEVMEDKWDIFAHSRHLYFRRSWTGDLIYRAQLELGHDLVRITGVEYPGGESASEGPADSVRAVNFLIKSHALGSIVPHPLPPDIEGSEEELALFSISRYGRRCWFGTYADTVPLQPLAAGTAGPSPPAS